MKWRFIAHARAKVNLYLEILAKRKDGYHEIETLFQTIDLFDRLDIEGSYNEDVLITSDDPNLPTDSKNLCHQAIKALARVSKENIGARIHIEKNIPMGAGLGGGSCDAAAVLLAANQGFSLGLSIEELEEIAACVGSDVPFMLYGGTMLGRGRGEKLTSVTDLKKGFFLVVKPPVEISTEWAYKNYNFRLTRHRHRFNLKALNAMLARFPEVRLSFRNSMEDVICPAYPEVAGILEELLATKPCFASMSGSGSAVYAIYESEANAARIAERFSVPGYFTAIAEPAERAIDLFPVAAH